MYAGLRSHCVEGETALMNLQKDKDARSVDFIDRLDISFHVVHAI
jgi:hypothetical protein